MGQVFGSGGDGVAAEHGWGPRLCTHGPCRELAGGWGGGAKERRGAVKHIFVFGMNVGALREELVDETEMA
jgi:hypothetical protein